jgi:hypothetical protein
MLEGLGLVMNLIAKYEVIELLYIWGDSGVKRLLEENIIKLYAAILEYLLEAHRYFTQKTATRIVKNIFQLEEVTTSFVIKIKSMSSNVNEYLQLSSAERQKKDRNYCQRIGRKFHKSGPRGDLGGDAERLRGAHPSMATQISTIEDNLREEER